MIRTYTMRLKVTKRQNAMLTDLLEHLCVLYNSALEWRKRSWEQERKSIRYYDQQKALTVFRQSPSVEHFPAAIQRDPLRRVDRAFRAFFRRVEAGQEPGYPRFKARSQYESFAVDGQNFCIDGTNITIVKLGSFCFKTGYKIKGKPLELRVKRCGNKWTASLVCDIGEAPPKIAVRNVVGIDLGLTVLVTLSDGTEIANLHWMKHEENRLAAASHALSAKKRGSKNRAKARERRRRMHQRIVGLRNDYLAQEAKKLLQKYDLVAYEDLTIAKMVQSDFGKFIVDAAWGKLIWRLQCEAEKAGKWVVPVNPYGTTIKCSGCGTKVPKKTSQRTHTCPSCGLVLGRDHNAALNILRLGKSLALEAEYAR